MCVYFYHEYQFLFLAIASIHMFNPTDFLAHVFYLLIARDCRNDGGRRWRMYDAAEQTLCCLSRRPRFKGSLTHVGVSETVLLSCV